MLKPTDMVGFIAYEFIALGCSPLVITGSSPNTDDFVILIAVMVLSEGTVNIKGFCPAFPFVTVLPALEYLPRRLPPPPVGQW